MVVAIIGLIGAVVSGVIGAAEGSANRKSAEELAKYEATKYKQFYAPQQSNNTVFAIIAIALVVLIFFFLYQINKNSNAK